MTLEELAARLEELEEETGNELLETLEDEYERDCVEAEDAEGEDWEDGDEAGDLCQAARRRRLGVAFRPPPGLQERGIQPGPLERRAAVGPCSTSAGQLPSSGVVAPVCPKLSQTSRRWRDLLAACTLGRRAQR